MTLRRTDALTRDERSRLSPEQWKAKRIRADVEKLRNPPPSLAGFSPTVPPPPRLEASPTNGKLAPHVARATLTQSLGEKLAALVTASKERNEPVSENDDPPPSDHRKAKRISRKVHRYLKPSERRLAIIDGYAFGSSEAAARWDVSQGTINSYQRSAEAVANGMPLPPEKGNIAIPGVNTPGSTRETAQAIIDEGMRLRNTPETVVEPSGPFNVVAASPHEQAVERVFEELDAEQGRSNELDVKLAERDATLAGYKHELEKLRIENAGLRQQVEILKGVTEALSASIQARRK